MTDTARPLNDLSSFMGAHIFHLCVLKAQSQSTNRKGTYYLYNTLLLYPVPLLHGLSTQKSKYTKTITTSGEDKIHTKLDQEPDEKSGSNPEYPIRPSDCVVKNLKVSSDMSPFQITYTPVSLSEALVTTINSSSPSLIQKWCLQLTQILCLIISDFIRGRSYIT